MTGLRVEAKCQHVLSQALLEMSSAFCSSAVSNSTMPKQRLGSGWQPPQATSVRSRQRLPGSPAAKGCLGHQLPKSCLASSCQKTGSCPSLSSKVETCVPSKGHMAVSHRLLCIKWDSLGGPSRAAQEALGPPRKPQDTLLIK